jgi:hypothetical protein
MNPDHAMESCRKLSVPVSVQLAIVAGGAVALYVAPSLVERICVPFFGPWFSVVLIGDVAGCAAVGRLSNWRYAAGLYLLLAVAKALTIRLNLLTGHELVWASDTIPAIISCALMLKVSGSKFAEEPEPPAEY